MKITFIGSSHGVPEPDRKCSSIMIEVKDKIYFVDMGTPAIDALRTRGRNIDDVKGVFITHMHGDHTNGLIQFVDLLTWYFKTPDPVICLPIMEAAQVIDNWLKVTLNNAPKEIKYQKTEAGVVYDDGTLKATAIPTQHCPHSFAYLLEAEGKAVLCTGDLKNPGVDFPTVAKEKAIDLLICESAHFPATDYLPVLEGSQVKKVCITHYSNKRLISVMECLAALSEKGIPALKASDDLELTV
ncbi:MAG: ribonuclease Z [Clostridiales bacterium]|nr:ribonuclease Z [Clostridiales bacterium]